MRAAQAFGVHDIRFVDDAPDPRPLTTDAVVQTEMASLCGSDLHMVDYGWQMPEYPAPPGHPGHEGVGLVVDPPKEYPEGAVDRFEPGDLVLTVPHIWYAKCFAETQAVDAGHLLKLPAGPPGRTPYDDAAARHCDLCDSTSAEIVKWTDLRGVGTGECRIVLGFGTETSGSVSSDCH